MKKWWNNLSSSKKSLAVLLGIWIGVCALWGLVLSMLFADAAGTVAGEMLAEARYGELAMKLAAYEAAEEAQAAAETAAEVSYTSLCTDADGDRLCDQQEPPWCRTYGKRNSPVPSAMEGCFDQFGAELTVPAKGGAILPGRDGTPTLTYHMAVIDWHLDDEGLYVALYAGQPEATDEFLTQEVN